MELRNIKFKYDDSEIPVIENLSLKIEKGMFLTIIGENGSAKSTLVKLMLGILKPMEGDVKCNFGKVSYVPQKKGSFNPDFPLTVNEMLKIHKKTSVGKTLSIEESLSMVSMEEYKNRLFGSLSGGQMQRILIARAILSQPDVIILDEPLTGIDQHSQNKIRSLLQNLHSKGVTIIAIEHDISFALHNSTHIMTMKEGKNMLYTVEDYGKKIGHDDWDNYIYHREESK